MKKIFTIVLSAVLCMSMSFTTFAATISTATGNASTQVKGTYLATGPTEVYSVDITWGNMEFTYNDATVEWNLSEHVWEAETPSSWTVDNVADNKIEIKSHSSSAVTASLSYVNEDGYEGISGSFMDASSGGNIITGSQFSIPAASALTKGSTPDAVAYLQLEGGRLVSGQTGITIGTVTVTLS